MRKGSGIAGATLLYGRRHGAPDLLLAMQVLIDDLRGAGRGISGVKLAGATLRLRAEPYEIVFTLTDGPLPHEAVRGLLRPPVGEAPDFARVHLARHLITHTRALAFLLRRRGAPPPDPDEALLALMREGQLALLPILRAASPALIIWQPGGLALTVAEFRAADPALLLTPGDVSAPLRLPRADRLGLPRPGAMVDAAPPPAPPRPPAIGIERAADRVTAALRPRHRRAVITPPRLLARVALAAMLPWLGWLTGQM